MPATIRAAYSLAGCGKLNTPARLVEVEFTLITGTPPEKRQAQRAVRYKQP
jgi:hypothetical protein